MMRFQTAFKVIPQDFPLGLGDFLRYAIVLFSMTFSFFGSVSAYAEDERIVGADTFDGIASMAHTDLPVPDLFTGTMSYRIPIAAPPGRKGLAPSVALTYHSNNGNGWLGVGWELEMGSIERSAKRGVGYSNGDNEYIFRSPAGVIELVNIQETTEYRAKVEGAFTKFIKQGSYWEAIDRWGNRSLFGSDSPSRLYDINDPDRVFKWCIDRLSDPNGNYMIFSYTKDLSHSPLLNQIYLNEIHYTGYADNDIATPDLLATNSIKFITEDRNDTSTMYTANFAVTSTKRLKAIEVWSNTDTNSQRVRKYVLNYDADSTQTGDQYSPLTNRSVLGSVTEYGIDDNFAKPSIILQYSNGYQVPEGSASGGWKFSLSTGISLLQPVVTNPVGRYCLPGRIGGSFDIICKTGSSGWDLKYLFTSPPQLGGISQWPSLTPYSLGQRCVTGDFKGEGKTGFACNFANNGNWAMAFQDEAGGSWSTETWSNAPAVLPISQCFGGDFDGNGKSDFACYAGDNTLKMALSTGSTWENRQDHWTEWPPNYISPSQNCLTGDFDGNGKTDFACNRGNSSDWTIFLSEGSGWSIGYWTSAGVTIPSLTEYPLSGNCLPGDFNGDAKTDVACYINSSWHVLLSTGVILATGGGGWDTAFTTGGPEASVPLNAKCLTGDFNGDGRTDITCYTSGGTWSTALSLGNGWNGLSWTGGPSPAISVGKQCFTGDFGFASDRDADGRTDIICYSGSGDSWEKATSYAPLTDLLTHVSNGLGGEINVSYTSSSTSNSLPFYTQIVSAVSVSDGKGITSTTSYEFSGGYYNVIAKEFRGFNYVKVTEPAGPNGERSITETWFHQGDDTAVDANTPSDAMGFMKGKPYRTRVSDNQEPGRIYSETETVYDLRTSSPYYFAPPTQVDTYTCDGNATGSCKNSGSARQTKIRYDYDPYGNVTLEDRYGNVGNPSDHLLNMTVERSFQPKTDAPYWLLGFPASETVYQGIGTTNSGNNLKKRYTKYFYDDVDCSGASQNYQSPLKGNLARTERWLAGDDYSVVRTGYDDYGNPQCVRDANADMQISERNYDERITDFDYDLTYQTFPTSTTNAKGQPTSRSYYGVGIAADKGRFGQLASFTDLNGAITSFEYDAFGRKQMEIQPDAFWTRTSYNNFGTLNDTVNSQNITVDNQLGLWSASYFDGLGRTFKTLKSGPDPENKFIVTETEYDLRGKVKRSSLPYFEGEAPVYRSYTYDPLGRVTRTDNPDRTYTLACYSDLISVFIDENGHRRREKRDPLGRLETVEEYTGVHSDCTTAQLTPYATTTYGYDVFGNLTGVTVDASKPGDPSNSKITEISYDNLGRKKTMIDPDMGRWDYEYYPDGTLYRVKDAKHQTNNQFTTFRIDELNRTIRKEYPEDSGTAIVFYNYDETTSTNPKGRLTSMTDASGKTVYHYDSYGRATKTVKQVKVDNVDVDYTIEKIFDGMGRLDKIIYPDNELVDYGYDPAGNLETVGGYARFAEYNALGQPRKLYYGNDIVDSYEYYSKNYRLLSSKTEDRQGASLQHRTYSYDKKGNVAGIDDLVNPAMPHNFTDGIVTFTLDPARAHAVQTSSTGSSYLYDDNGNMRSDGQRTVTYTPDNLPKSITMNSITTSFVYDGNGTRVKKAGGGDERIYVGKLHECVTGGACGKYIFAGERRMAFKDDTATYYYHPDHLGSTSIITDGYATKREEIAYYPFGETRQDTGSVTMLHKYTGQELDNETGLYNHGARLYNPEIGRFISPDKTPPNMRNPQSINPYAYCGNNPLKYTDPSGKSWFHVVTEIPGSFVGWAFGGPNPYQAVAYQWNMDRRDLSDYSPKAMARHATSGAGQAWSNAMGASWDNFTVKIGNINTVGEANHTFADIISHLGTSWTPETTTTGKIWHYAFNDIILGGITAPITAAESILGNLYSGVMGLFGGSEATSATPSTTQNSTDIGLGTVTYTDNSYTSNSPSNLPVLSDGTHSSGYSSGDDSTGLGDSGFWSWLFGD